MPSTTSPNMSLTIPTTSVEPGPAYANDINASLSQIDIHNHTTGLGVPVPSSGLNINSDLPFGNNNATTLRSTRFTAQSSPIGLAADLNCVYASGVDLYYNDGNGNKVRITQSGGVAGSPGSITNLTSPASVSYVSANQTYVFQSDTNTAGNLDVGSVIFRNVTASSNGITMSAPAGLGSNYTITLPSLPAVKGFLTLDSSGTISNVAFTGGIVAANIANGTLTTTQISSSAGIVGTQLADGAGLTPNQMGVAYSAVSNSGAAISQSLTGSGGTIGSLSTTSANVNPNNVRPFFLTFSQGFLALSTINTTCDITVTISAITGVSTLHTIATFTLPSLTLANSPQYFPMSAFNCIDYIYGSGRYSVAITGTNADARMVLTSAVLQLVQV